MGKPISRLALLIVGQAILLADHFGQVVAHLLQRHSADNDVLINDVEASLFCDVDDEPSRRASSAITANALS